MKNLVFFGPPGSGKGTQINKLAELISLNVISTGKIARDLAKNDIEVKKTLDRGELISDEVIFKEVKKAIEETDKETSIIFDGFPRNLIQAKKLDEILLHYSRILDAAIYIYLEEAEVVNRLTKRKVCSKCGQPFSSEEVCPNCGGKALKRDDDNEATIINRMQVFLERTLPLVTYYEKKNLLIQINGNQSVEDVAKDIKEGLNL